MVNAIASETGAYLFNLSPRNVAGQYIGKSNVTRLVHTVFKVAKANAPSVIYIDNFEMIFAKKVPKTDPTDPKRFKKDILKQLKSLSPNEGVLFVGVSHKPWEGDVKAFLSLFERVLYCPRPDYGSRYILWSHYISKKVTLEFGQLDVSLLARISKGLSSGDIEKWVGTTLNPRRLGMVSSFIELQYQNLANSITHAIEL